MKKWKDLNKSSSDTTHSYDCCGLDIVLLDWIGRCKMNVIQMETTAIETVAKKLADIFKVSPCYIKAKRLNQIHNILQGESIFRKTNNISLETFIISAFLKNDGSQLPKPQTCKRILRALERNSHSAVKIMRRIKRKEHSFNSDVCIGIDVLLLDWIKRCKRKRIKLTLRAVIIQSTNLSNILKVYGYNFKSHIWNQIKEMLRDQSKASRPVKKISAKPYQLLRYLQKFGSPILKPETYQKFLKILRTQLCKSVDVVEYKMKTVPRQPRVSNDILTAKNETDCTLASSMYIPRLPPNNLNSVTENKNVPTITDEALENVKCNYSIPDETVAVSKNGNSNDFICVSDNEETPGSATYEQPDNANVIEILGVNDQHMPNDQKETKELLQNSDENLTSLYNNMKASSTECFTRELSIPQHYNKLIDIYDNRGNGTQNLAENVEKSVNNKVQVAFEIYDSDDELNNELLDKLHKHTEENRMNLEENIIAETDTRQDAIDEIDSLNDEVSIVLEVHSDEDDENDQNNKHIAKLNNLVQETEIESLMKTPTCQESINQRLVKRKRSTYENIEDVIEDNTPSTSQLAISTHSPISIQPTKKQCLYCNESRVQTTLKIKSNVEAFKYLHSVKNYFKSHNNEMASQLITKLMMSLLCSGDLYTRNK